MQSKTMPASDKLVGFSPVADLARADSSTSHEAAQQRPACPVALFVVGGVGNLGNDASLEAMIASVRKLRPEAGIVSFCGNPERVTARFSLPALRMRPRPGEGPLYRLVNKLTLRQLSLARQVRHIWQSLKGVEVMLVPGTGILDDFGTKPFDFPLRMLLWCAATRLRGAKIAFVSAGAGPITHPLSRRFMLGAARLAAYRSYRDEVSRSFMAEHGVGLGKDAVYPDLVLGLPLEKADPLGPPCLRAGSERPHTIGIGVMNYHGWSDDRALGRNLHRRYMMKLAYLALKLAERGNPVRLLFGHDDEPAIAEMSAILAELRGAAGARIELAMAKTLSELAAEIAGTDIVVGTRYHTVVAALMLGRPVISVGYAAKFEAIMANFGQAEHCENIEKFTVADVIAKIDRLVADYAEIHRDLARPLADARARLAEQELLIEALLPGAPPVAPAAWRAPSV